MHTAPQHIEELPSDTQDQGNGLMKALLIAAIVASSLSMIFSVGTAMASASASSGNAQIASE